MVGCGFVKVQKSVGNGFCKQVDYQHAYVNRL